MLKEDITRRSFLKRAGAMAAVSTMPLSLVELSFADSNKNFMFAYISERNIRTMLAGTFLAIVLIALTLVAALLSMLAAATRVSLSPPTVVRSTTLNVVPSCSKKKPLAASKWPMRDVMPAVSVSTSAPVMSTSMLWPGWYGM